MSQIARASVPEPAEADRITWRENAATNSMANIHPIRTIDRINSSLPSAAASGSKTVATV